MCITKNRNRNLILDFIAMLEWPEAGTVTMCFFSLHFIFFLACVLCVTETFYEWSERRRKKNIVSLMTVSIKLWVDWTSAWIRLIRNLKWCKFDIKYFPKQCKRRRSSTYMNHRITKFGYYYMSSPSQIDNFLI